MPRPASGDVLKLELRMTPPDQRPVTDWYESDLQAGARILVCGEGEPNGTPRLHYHIYIETTISLSSVRKWINKVLESHKELDVKYNGNSLYFTRQPHDHTIPYILKSRNILIRVGFAQQTIDEYFRQSDEYVKNKESERKRKTRTRLDEMEQIFDEIQKDSTIRTPGKIIDRALYLCNQYNYKFPSKSTFETYIMKLMYNYDPSFVRSYYEKPFADRY